MTDEDRIALLRKQLMLYAEQNRLLMEAQLEVNQLSKAIQEVLSSLQQKIGEENPNNNAKE